jgi:hypothetical protein
MTLYKSGDISNPSNYRGTTLVAMLQKLLSIVVLHRLEYHVKLPGSQTSFREKPLREDQEFMLTRISDSTHASRSRHSPKHHFSAAVPSYPACQQ